MLPRCLDSCQWSRNCTNGISWIVSEVVIVFFMALELNNLVGS
jgi:hypothetical protein